MPAEIEELRKEVRHRNFENFIQSPATVGAERTTPTSALYRSDVVVVVVKWKRDCVLLLCDRYCECGLLGGAGAAPGGGRVALVVTVTKWERRSLLLRAEFKVAIAETLLIE